jgi:hypothetical protein
MTTHRQTFIDQLPSRNFLGGLHRQALIDAARDGLDALATLWFDEYDDEDTLPIDIININTFLMELTGEEAPLVTDALEGDN